MFIHFVSSPIDPPVNGFVIAIDIEGDLSDGSCVRWLGTFNSDLEDDIVRSRPEDIDDDFCAYVIDDINRTVRTANPKHLLGISEYAEDRISKMLLDFTERLRKVHGTV